MRNFRSESVLSVISLKVILFQQVAGNGLELRIPVNQGGVGFGGSSGDHQPQRA